MNSFIKFVKKNTFPLIVITLATILVLLLVALKNEPQVEQKAQEQEMSGRQSSFESSAVKEEVYDPQWEEKEDVFVKDNKPYATVVPKPIEFSELDTSNFALNKEGKIEFNDPTNQKVLGVEQAELEPMSWEGMSLDQKEEYLFFTDMVEKRLGFQWPFKKIDDANSLSFKGWSFISNGENKYTIVYEKEYSPYGLVSKDGFSVKELSSILAEKNSSENRGEFYFYSLDGFSIISFVPLEYPSKEIEEYLND